MIEFSTINADHDVVPDGERDTGSLVLVAFPVFLEKKVGGGVSVRFELAVAPVPGGITRFVPDQPPPFHCLAHAAIHRFNSSRIKETHVSSS